MNFVMTILLAPLIWGWRLVLLLAMGQDKLVFGVYRWFKGVKGSDTHGTAVWADKRDLRKAGHLKPEGFFVGLLDGVKVYTAAASSVLIFAPKRTGKSWATIAMLLEGMKTPQDWIVVDPEGGIRAKTFDAFIAAGYRVLLMNLSNPPDSNTHYNPLTIIRPTMPYEFQRDVTNAAYSMLPDDTHSREEHFQNMARMMVEAALIVGFRSNGVITPTEVAEVLTDKGKRHKLLQQALVAPDLLARQAAGAFVSAGEKEQGSFITTITRKMKEWGSPIVRDTLCDDPTMPWTWEMIFNDAKPSVLFIQCGLGSVEGNATRLILDSAINTRRRMHNHGHEFMRWFRPVIDESLTVGNSRAIVDANNELGKAKVATWMAWLTYGDIKAVYGDAAKGLINNSDLIAFGGGKDMEFYEVMSKILGKKTIESGSVNENNYGESKGRSETGRPLVMPEEARALPFSDCIATLGPLNVRLTKGGSILK